MQKFTNRGTGGANTGRQPNVEGHNISEALNSAMASLDEFKKMRDKLEKKIFDENGKRARAITLNGMDAKLIEMSNGNIRIEFTSIPVDTVRNELYDNGFTIEGK